MGRRRLAVILLVNPPWAAEIDGLRRACGDGKLDRVPPHLTLVPPVNVAADALPAALAVLRSAAAAVERPLTLTLGPPTTFAPVSPTLYLRVSDPQDQPGELARLHRLQRRVLAGPYDRPVTHPFVAHVTLLDSAGPDRLTAAEAALASYRVIASFSSVHVLQEHRDGDGVRRWRLLADALFEPAAVVGRGGLPVELFTSSVFGPEEAEVWEAVTGELGPGHQGGERVIVTARRDHEVLGVACATHAPNPAGQRIALVEGVVVAGPHRRQGVGRALLDALDHRLALCGTTRAEVQVGDTTAASLFTARGWRELEPGHFLRSWS